MWDNLSKKLVTGKLELQPKVIHINLENNPDNLSPASREETEPHPNQASTQLKKNYFRSDPLKWAVPSEQSEQQEEKPEVAGNLDITLNDTETSISDI